jgi:uncharacterized delta-60 repeat protein
MSTPRRGVWIAATIACFVLLPGIPARATHPGKLDQSFGSGGRVVTPVGGGDAAASAIALQPDGKIVVAGYGSNGTDDDSAVARYLSDGTLDPSFGDGGIALTDLGGADRAEAVALQPDGDIVAAGFSDNSVAVVRYTTDGNPDATFGDHGVARTTLGGPESAEAVAIQQDGRILVAGWLTRQRQADMVMVRYTAHGVLDPTFSRAGVYTLNLSPNDFLSALAVQADGRIVAAGASGEAGTQFAVIRLRRSGILDKAFGAGTGIVVTPFPGTASWGNAMVLQPDGMICVAGFAYDGVHYRAALARYSPAGAPDPAFGAGGKVIAKLGPGDATVQSMALQPDGRIVVAGGLAEDFVVARFTSDGNLDPTFASRGSARTDLGSNDQSAAVALQPDGRVVLAGFSGDEDRIDLALARYLN